MTKHSGNAIEPAQLAALGETAFLIAIRATERANRYQIALDEIAHREGLTVAACRQIAQHALTAKREGRE